MIVRVLVRRRADRDGDAIADHIGNHNADAGRRFLLALRRDFQFLMENPNAGGLRTSARASLSGLRSWPVKGFENYLIFYLRKRNRIEIVRVIHGARNVGRLFGEQP